MCRLRKKSVLAAGQELAPWCSGWGCHPRGSFSHCSVLAGTSRRAFLQTYCNLGPERQAGPYRHPGFPSAGLYSLRWKASHPLPLLICGKSAVFSNVRNSVCACVCMCVHLCIYGCVRTRIYLQAQTDAQGWWSEKARSIWAAFLKGALKDLSYTSEWIYSFSPFFFFFLAFIVTSCVEFLPCFVLSTLAGNLY